MIFSRGSGVVVMLSLGLLVADNMSRRGQSSLAGTPAVLLAARPRPPAVIPGAAGAGAGDGDAPDIFWSCIWCRV
jgi:hypothetical protein